MMVALVHAIAGEVLHGTGDTRLSHALQIGLAVFQHQVGVGAERSVGDDRVAPVEQQIDDRGEGPVAADGRGLDARDAAHLVGPPGVIGCA